MLEIKCPAKINYILEISGKSSDDFHIIKTLAIKVDLVDTVYIEEAKFGLEFSSNVSLPVNNSIVKTVYMLVEKGYIPHSNFKIHLQKRIPLASGLGSASSTAVEVAKALCKHFASHTPKLEELVETAGSDAAIFYLDSTAVIVKQFSKFKFEINSLEISLIKKLPQQLFLFFLPSFKNKTKNMYSKLTPEIFSDKFEELLTNLQPFNTFEAVFPYKTFLNTQNLHLSGAGPTLFSTEQLEGGLPVQIWR